MYIEAFISEILLEDAQKNALEFVTYLRANEMIFEKGIGYWEDKHYWMIKYKNEYVCFILVNGYGAPTGIKMSLRVGAFG